MWSSIADRPATAPPPARPRQWRGGARLKGAALRGLHTARYAAGPPRQRPTLRRPRPTASTKWSRLLPSPAFPALQAALEPGLGLRSIPQAPSGDHCLLPPLGGLQATPRSRPFRWPPAVLGLETCRKLGVLSELQACTWALQLRQLRRERASRLAGGSARAGMLSTDIRSVETGDPCAVQLGGAFVLPFIAGDRDCRADRAGRTKDH